MFHFEPLPLRRRVTLYVVLAGLVILRFVFSYLRLRLYRKRRAAFERLQPASATEEWRRALSSGHRIALSWSLILAFFIGVGYLASFHPGMARWLGDAIMGMLLFTAAIGFCQESYYFVNRRLILKRPRAARRAYLRAPRSGLVLEAILAGYVMLAVWIACAAAPVPFLIGAVLATTFVFLSKLLRVFTKGRRLAAEAAEMRDGLAPSPKRLPAGASGQFA